MAVELASELLEILACPNCHGGLAVDHDRDELVCTSPDCQLAYPVQGGIPVLLIDEARPPKRKDPEPATKDPAKRPEPVEGHVEGQSGTATDKGE